MLINTKTKHKAPKVSLIQFKKYTANPLPHLQDNHNQSQNNPPQTNPQNAKEVVPTKKHHNHKQTKNKEREPSSSDKTKKG